MRPIPLERLAPGESPELRQGTESKPMGNEIMAVVNAVRAIPDFDAAIRLQEYQYASLGHCVLDSIFSIGVRYEGVRGVLHRYCQRYQLHEFHDGLGPPPVADQLPLSGLVDQISEVGPERFATEIVQNRQRTSSRSGILKAEASLLFAEALIRNGVETFQDAMEHIADQDLDRELRGVPGQASGISIRYFFMLAGSPDLIKPDRMIIRFLKGVLGRDVSPEAAVRLLAGVVIQLRTAGLSVDARSIDSAIWLWVPKIRNAGDS
jgi:hypothetical protein